MKTRFTLLIAAGLLLAGCETGPRAQYGGHLPPPPPPPPRGEYEWSTANGANVVEGVGVWRRDHHVFSCAGQSVVLVPETRHSRERMKELYGSDEQAIRSVAEVRARSTGGPPPYAAYVKSMECDAQGRFGFHGLADGGWFVILRGSSRSGAAEVAMLRIHVQGGERRAVKIGG